MNKNNNKFDDLIKLLKEAELTYEQWQKIQLLAFRKRFKILDKGKPIEDDYTIR